MKAIVGTFNQMKALIGQNSRNLREGLFEALSVTAANVTELHLGAGRGIVGMQD